MPRPRCRRFTITDGIVLVAAIAAGCALVRALNLSIFGEMWNGPTGHRTLMMVYGTATSLATVLLLFLIPLRLRQPRPGWSRLARQPGFAASCVVAASLACGLLHFLPTIGPSVRELFANSWQFGFYYFSATAFVDYSVAGAWLLLAVSGRWRSEPGWIDRLGRLAGAVWVAHLLIFPFLGWLSRWVPAV